ncbi:MAG: segregation and condensation protein A, partial [Salinispira sp.]
MEKTQFKLSNFEGSLDLLLFLLRKNEVNIYDIPIAQITDQYLSILNDETFTNLDTASDFYLMAATLMHIKSRMLVSSSTDIDEDAEDPRQELVERLIEYQKYKKLTSLMTEQTVQDEWTIEREKIQRSLPFPDDGNAWKELDVWELMITFSRIIHSLIPEHLVNLYEEVSINEKITLIQEKIQLRQDFSFTD